MPFCAVSTPSNCSTNGCSSMILSMAQHISLTWAGHQRQLVFRVHDLNLKVCDLCQRWLGLLIYLGSRCVVSTGAPNLSACPNYVPQDALDIRWGSLLAGEGYPRESELKGIATLGRHCPGRRWSETLTPRRYRVVHWRQLCPVQREQQTPRTQCQ